jgi:release factor glutamine methyltransferase
MSNQFDSKRQLSVYEKQQLIKYGLKETDFLQEGEMPIEYFTTKVDFADLTLNIGSEVLIPRVETEELIDLAMETLNNCKEKDIKILDLGTGSGAIALALINRLIKSDFQGKNWQFCLTDSSNRALALAKKNYYELFKNSVNNKFLQIDFLLSDLLNKVPKNLQFDLVLANLPYIPSAKIRELTSSVRDFEPIVALDGGKDGFDLIATALKQLLSAKFLSDSATLFFETHESHNYQFIKENYSFIIEAFEIDFIKDQFARQRFFKLRKKSLL